MATATKTTISPKSNLALWDRILRVILGLGLFVAAIGLPVSGVVAATAALFGGIQLTTGLDGY